MSIGQIAAQLVHAAGESGPVERGCFAVVLAARDEKHLLAIESELQYLKIPHCAIREPDMGDSITAIGIRPVVDKSIVKPITRRLKLLRRTTNG